MKDMKKNILSLLAISLILGSCDYNDKYFDGLDDMSKPQDINKVEYLLTADDYKAISNNKENKALAASMDEGVIVEGKPDSTHIKALKAFGSKQMFDDVITPAEFLPAFIANKWYYKDELTEIVIKYNTERDRPQYIKDLDATREYILSADDYEAVWGDTGVEYLTPKKPLKGIVNNILMREFPDAEKNAIALVNFNYSVNEPGNTGGEDPILFSEDFEGDTPWFEQLIKGEKKWEKKNFNANNYMSFSSNKSGEKNETYLVSPSIAIKEGAQLSFDITIGFFNGKTLSVLISDNFDGKDVTKAKWNDITSSFTIPEEPVSGYGKFVNAGVCDLKDYVGKKVFIAFRYIGDGSAGATPTTTIQLDNILVTTEKATTRVISRASESDGIQRLAHVYKLGGTDWYLNDKTLGLSRDDYDQMGIKEFDDKTDPNQYLPKFLSIKLPFAKDGQTQTVLYKFKDTFVGADYEFSAETNEWTFIPYHAEESKQFVFLDGKWVFNPSKNIILTVGTNNPESSAFYQPITDWVWENIDQKEGITEKGKGYVHSYGNSEYYFGTSAYQNNIDMRLGKYREQKAEVYGEMSDDELKAFLMKERWPEGFKLGLELAYPNDEPIEGMEVFYTLQFGTYDGAGHTYSIKYQLVGKGEFEFVEESIVKIN